jgi:hypothetical protein
MTFQQRKAMTTLNRARKCDGRWARYAAGVVLLSHVALTTAGGPPLATASSCAADSLPAGAIDGDRFACDAQAAWKGGAGGTEWWWQIEFPRPRRIGAILQINGDNDEILQNTPESYVWQWSLDGQSWNELPDTRILDEERAYRLHRLSESKRARFMRLAVTQVSGEFPTLREVEFCRRIDARVKFDDWFVIVSTTESPDLPGPGMEFGKLAKQCEGWEDVQVQQVWLGSFDETFVATEPRPICAFLSGNFEEWCKRTRQPWRGTQEVLENRYLPIWASCGGAQALAILSTVGVNHKWDCPRCRDPQNPKSPVYGHIGHRGPSPCGVYTNNVDERGIFHVRQVARDPAFAGLPIEFEIRESHCGQIEWVPDGWVLVVTRGRGARTRVQCMRICDRPIYAAQFHMELFEGTEQNSRTVIGNFLTLAKEWGGYNPDGRSLAMPKPVPYASR